MILKKYLHVSLITFCCTQFPSTHALTGSDVTELRRLSGAGLDLWQLFVDSGSPFSFSLTKRPHNYSHSLAFCSSITY